MRIIHKYSNDVSTNWNSFVSNANNSTFFHLIGWKNILEKTFGYQSFYMYAEKNERISGILPLFLIRGLLSGKAFVSLPFGVYGGICAENEEITEMLLEEAKALTNKLNANYLELRHRDNICMNLPFKKMYYTFIKELPREKSVCLEMLPRKTRAAARKSIESGLEFQTGVEFLKEFYNVYAVSVRNLGSPIFPFRYLQNIIAEFPHNSIVSIVRYKGKSVAGVFTFVFKDTIMPYYAGSLPQYFAMQPNNFMYLKLMEYGVEHGFRWFDFGRSKAGTGAFKFKEFHGFEPKQLYYQYYLNGKSDLPDTSSKNPKLEFLVKTWQKMPVCLTKIIGSRLIKFTPP